MKCTVIKYSFIHVNTNAQTTGNDIEHVDETVCVCFFFEVALMNFISVPLPDKLVSVFVSKYSIDLCSFFRMFHGFFFRRFLFDISSALQIERTFIE